MCVNQVTLSKPINNGFTLKFNPDSAKEVIKPKTFGALFAKNTQEMTHNDANIQNEILSKAIAFSSNSTEHRTASTSQMSKILLPSKKNLNDNYSMNTNYINIPVIQQPFNDYKILVATAPSNFRISGAEEKPVVVYVVFSEDEATDTKSINIPAVYFVRKPSSSPDLNKLQKIDTVLVIDSNRTVTGLKSKAVAKFVKFKNKMTTRYNYKLTQR